MPTRKYMDHWSESQVLYSTIIEANGMAAAFGMMSCASLRRRRASRCATCARAATAQRERGLPAPPRFTRAGESAVHDACRAQMEAEGVARMQRWLVSPEALQAREALLAQKNGRL